MFHMTLHIPVMQLQLIAFVGGPLHMEDGQLELRSKSRMLRNLMTSHSSLYTSSCNGTIRANSLGGIVTETEKSQEPSARFTVGRARIVIHQHDLISLTV